ncbi:hypothetical protein [Novosphingobium sp. ST904]|uniref:hypothetical protein n=1 Tax=Novosphingobium sp. ST904 TaxID=1684385 RepID=UPI0012E32995|nr:hypothetical protein [Novosphingobium sp. ST904]
MIAAMALGLALSASAQANAGTKAYGSTFGKSSYAQERFGKSPFRPGPLKGAINTIGVMAARTRAMNTGAATMTTTSLAGADPAD